MFTRRNSCLSYGGSVVVFLSCVMVMALFSGCNTPTPQSAFKLYPEAEFIPEEMLRITVQTSYADDIPVGVQREFERAFLHVPSHSVAVEKVAQTPPPEDTFYLLKAKVSKYMPAGRASQSLKGMASTLANGSIAQVTYVLIDTTTDLVMGRGFIDLKQAHSNKNSSRSEPNARELVAACPRLIVTVLEEEMRKQQEK